MEQNNLFRVLRWQSGSLLCGGVGEVGQASRGPEALLFETLQTANFSFQSRGQPESRGPWEDHAVT